VLQRAPGRGEYTDCPYVLFLQQTPFDPSRAPAGQHTAWAYCHVPRGSTRDMTGVIEAQIEHFAPGFRDVVLARSTHNAAQMEAHDANYVGGDINVLSLFWLELSNLGLISGLSFSSLARTPRSHRLRSSWSAI
jgi:phytoene dehydrogenase-like protein